jgi:hypothetical protein
MSRPMDHKEHVLLTFSGSVRSPHPLLHKRDGKIFLLIRGL